MAEHATSKPMVSVVIPAYGLPDYLNEAVRSVLEQTFTDYEIIVVDDCSPEGVVGAYQLPAEARLIVHEERHGAASATRNSGLRVARGKYVAFLDQDDIWLPEKLAKHVEAMEKSPDAGLSFSHYTTVDEKLTPLPDQRPPRRYVRDPLRKLLSGCFIRTPSAVVIRRDVLEKCGLFDESILGASDWDCYLRIAREHSFLAIPERLILYRMHPSQLHKNHEMMRGAKYKIMEKTLAWARSERASVLSTVRQRYSRILRQAAKAQIAGGDPDGAVATLKQAIGIWPWNPRAYGLLIKAKLRRRNASPAVPA